jgi:hypothetical protein
MRAMAWRRSRDTCIWEQPTRAAISYWLRSAKNAAAPLRAPPRAAWPAEPEAAFLERPGHMQPPAGVTQIALKLAAHAGNRERDKAAFSGRVVAVDRGDQGGPGCLGQVLAAGAAAGAVAVGQPVGQSQIGEHDLFSQAGSRETAKACSHASTCATSASSPGKTGVTWSSAQGNTVAVGIDHSLKAREHDGRQAGAWQRAIQAHRYLPP